MRRIVGRSCPPLLLGGLALAAGSGCLCPPCQEGAGAAAPAANAGNAPPLQPLNIPAAAVATPPVASNGRLLIWDGEGAGASAQGWSSCDTKPDCKVSFAKDGAAGVDGTTGLKFHGEGPGWIGAGWNWFGWYPETAGVDLTPYTHLTFQIRVEPAANAETAVDPEAVSVALACSKGQQASADAPVRRYEKDFADGKWHKVSIPLEAFTKGKGAAFDPHTAWEFHIFQWSATPRNFTIDVDQIAAEKQ
jgi:hypothetical protein